MRQFMVAWRRLCCDLAVKANRLAAGVAKRAPQSDGCCRDVAKVGIVDDERIRDQRNCSFADREARTGSICAEIAAYLANCCDVTSCLP
jgi:hypothetical protein